jgi:protein TIF31
VTIVASRAGFYPSGKRALISHSLVGLLQQTNRGFEGVSQPMNLSALFLIIGCSFLWKRVSDLQAYKALMKAFVEHNKVRFTNAWFLAKR